MKKMKNYLVLVVIAIALSSSFTSCMKPYQEERFVEIEPNETAFVIPLEEQTKNNQNVLNSESYLNEKKVAAKRIGVPTRFHQTGRMSWSGEWIPTVRVIKVDRTPVTREWTAADGTGTSGNKKENIEVESKESIGFGIGITSTATIPEEWAAKFLYNYNGKTLAEVMDNDVRAYIQNILTSEFGILILSKCQAERKNIYDKMRNLTTEYFSNMGIRILNIGAAGQFDYTDESIQIAINEKFASEMKIETSSNLVAAANNFARAASNIEKQKMLDARILNLEADANLKNGLAIGFENGTTKLPDVVSPSMLEGLMGLDLTK